MGNSKNLIGAFLVAAGIFLFWAWALPSYQAASALRDVVSEKEIEYTKKRETVDKIKQWALQYEQRREDIDRFQKVVPDRRYADEAIVAIEKIMSESGFQIASIDTTDIEISGGSSYSKVSFELVVNGTYEALATALDQIEKNIRLMDVKEINISRLSTTIDNAGTLNVQMTLEAYIANTVSRGSGQNN